MSLVREQADFMKDVARLIVFATEQGWLVTGGELWRTKEQQKIYYQTGKSKTMNSNHLKRLAIDLNFFKSPLQPVYSKTQLAEIGKFWESLNPKNRWGGNFRNFEDTPHFERNI